MMLKVLQSPLFRMVFSPVPALVGGSASVGMSGAPFLLEQKGSSPEPAVRPLSGFEVGTRLRVVQLGGDEVMNQRLRDLGLREGVRCSVVLSNGKLILSVGECRIALRREVAQHVLACELSE